MLKKNLSRIRSHTLAFLGVPTLKQHAMLLVALTEKGFNPRKLKINVDHTNGQSYVNGIRLPVIYPDSFFAASEQLHAVTKSHRYYFNGNMSPQGGRAHLLAPFISDGGKIVESEEGRRLSNKSRFNEQYYGELASSHLGLCPNQVDWPGPKENIWTYRFIECCMVLTLPVVFRETPLGSEFVKDINFIYDDDAFSKHLPIDRDVLLLNFKKVKKYYTLHEDHIAQIRNS